MLLEPTSTMTPGLASPGSVSPRTGGGSQHGTINRNYACAVSPAVDRSEVMRKGCLALNVHLLRNESLRDNINAAKTLVIILIVFFVCWFPFFLTYILSFVGKVSRYVGGRNKNKFNTILDRPNHCHTMYCHCTLVSQRTQLCGCVKIKGQGPTGNGPTNSPLVLDFMRFTPL